jgi:hypothetical protein
LAAEARALTRELYFADVERALPSPILALNAPV